MKHKKILSLVLVLVILIGAFPMPANAASFTDVSDHWALKYINWADDNGYVNGYPDVTFKPDGNMTRAEFVKILNRFICVREKADIRFEDVRPSDWYFDEVRIAVKYGYLEDGKLFRGNENITRDEVMRMLAYVYKISGDESVVARFVDQNEVISKRAVSALVANKVVEGYPDETIRPLMPITRAEVAKLLHVARTILGEPELCKKKVPTSDDSFWWLYPVDPDPVYPIPDPDPICPKDAALKAEFAKAVGVALGNVNLDPKIAKFKYRELTKTANVEIIDLWIKLRDITGTGAMAELKKLVDTKGLISYQFPGQPLRNLTNATIEEMNDWIIRDLVKSLDNKAYTLGRSLGKSLSVKVVFRQDKECPEITDTYTVEFKDGVGAKIVWRTPLEGRFYYLIELAGATYNDLEQVKIGEKILPRSEINYPSSDNHQFAFFYDTDSIPTIEITVKGQKVIID